jgi:uncharacterized protein
MCRKETSWEDNPWKPFCSERCQLFDLGKWSAEDYRVPVSGTPDAWAAEEIPAEIRFSDDEA